MTFKELQAGDWFAYRARNYIKLQGCIEDKYGNAYAAVSDRGEPSDLFDDDVEVIPHDSDKYAAKATFKSEQVMPIVDGVRFRCPCGCNVFTKYNNMKYRCNACEARYTGE